MRRHHSPRPDGGTAHSQQAVADGGTEPQIEIVDAEGLSGGERADVTVGGVLLAAGPGERYEGDQFKLLEEIEGSPMVYRAAKAMTESDLEEVVVVVGHEKAAVRDALGDLDVSIVENERYEEGQSTSMHLGVEAAREGGWDAVLFGLGDMPFVTPGIVNLLVEAYATGHDTPIAAGFEENRGNPTLFDEQYYDELMEITGDTGGRPIMMGRSSITVVETGDPGVVRDIDTRADYESYL